MATDQRTTTEKEADDQARASRPQPRVRDAQRMLGITETGKMGNPTRDALRAYQLAASLPVTGDLDAATWKALHQ